MMKQLYKKATAITGLAALPIVVIAISGAQDANAVRFPPRGDLYITSCEFEKGGGLSVFDSQGFGFIANLPAQHCSSSVAVAKMSLPNRLSDSVYMLDHDSGQVSVISRYSNSIIRNIAVGDNPQWLALSPDGTRLYIVNNHGVVKVVDTVNSQLISVIPTQAFGTTRIVLSPDGSRAYVSGSLSNNVSVVDMRLWQEIAVVGLEPSASTQSIDITPDGSKLFVAERNLNKVAVIDTSRLIVTDLIHIPSHEPQVASLPTDLTTTSDGRYVYVSHASETRVSLIDARRQQLLRFINVPFQPSTIESSLNGRIVYVVVTPAAGNKHLLTIDTNTQRATLARELHISTTSDIELGARTPSCRAVRAGRCIL